MKMISKWETDCVFEIWNSGHLRRVIKFYFEVLFPYPYKVFLQSKGQKINDEYMQSKKIFLLNLRYFALAFLNIPRYMKNIEKKNWGIQAQILHTKTTKFVVWLSKICINPERPILKFSKFQLIVTHLDILNFIFKSTLTFEKTTTK